MPLNTSMVQPAWDYSLQAPYYQYRPNYSQQAISVLLNHINPGAQPLKVADIGAGTGNLSILLKQFNLDVDAVEPNDEMRNLGIKRTSDTSIRWVKANGTQTGLPEHTYDWVTFGSSFNVIDREAGLQETARLLKPDGYFSCLWNHRNLQDPVQSAAENIIMKFVPDYERGVRREDQRPILEASPLFEDIFYIELDFRFDQTLEHYLNAWRSVKNRFWDLQTDEGNTLFNTICTEMRRELPETFTVQYTTRAWTARRAR